MKEFSDGERVYHVTAMKSGTVYVRGHLPPATGKTWVLFDDARKVLRCTNDLLVHR